MKKQALIGLMLWGSAVAPVPASDDVTPAASPPLVTAAELSDAIFEGRATPVRIAFDPGTDAVARDSIHQLVELAALLRNDPQVRIELTIPGGDLASRRAWALQRELTALGVSNVTTVAKVKIAPTTPAAYAALGRQ